MEITEAVHNLTFDPGLQRVHLKSATVSTSFVPNIHRMVGKEKQELMMTKRKPPRHPRVCSSVRGQRGHLAARVDFGLGTGSRPHLKETKHTDILARSRH
jgi:hypothetical protein